jgi:hypothetical protein
VIPIKTKLDDIKKEMLELVSKNLELDSPEAIAWMEKAANNIWKDKLQAGQIWQHDGVMLVKTWTN